MSEGRINQTVADYLYLTGRPAASLSASEYVTLINAPVPAQTIYREREIAQEDKNSRMDSPKSSQSRTVAKDETMQVQTGQEKSAGLQVGSHERDQVSTPDRKKSHNAMLSMIKTVGS